MGFSFLKFVAKQKLEGGYFKAVLGAVIYYIPAYIISMINTVLIANGMGTGALAVLMTVVLNVCVLDVFLVGYMRSLLKMSDSAEVSPTSKGKYDVNLVLSGYQQNCKNTIKILFFKRLYLWGWELLTILPMLLCLGILAFMSYRPEILQLFKLLSQLIMSPTDIMAKNLINHILQNCAYVLYMLTGAGVASMLLIIPYIRKLYEYEMIPMLLAEDPDISKKQAFDSSREIMHGYRLNYFSLQISFIGVIILASFITVVIPVEQLSYFAMALVLPYMNMTFLQFYLARTRVYQDNTNQTVEN